MKRSCLIMAALVVLLVVPEDCPAIGRGGGGRGGGGISRGGGGGISRGGGGARPSMASRPHTSTPNLGGSRPNVSHPQTRPNISRPTSRPQVSRPSGGLKPSTQPGLASRPNVGSRPNIASRPTTLPGSTRPGLASHPGSRPSTSLPNLGGSRPGTNRPGGGVQRPGGGIDLANRPNLGNRPGTGNRPNPGDRPGLANRPGGDRPSPGDLGDFLGMDKPLRPGGSGGIASTLPGRPGLGDRSGIGDRPGLGNRPGIGDRPGIGERPGIGDRPNIGDRWNNNNVIGNRPRWANIDNSTNINIHNRWNNAFTNANNRGWWNRPSGRVGYWKGWADGVRDGWGYYNRHNNWFAGNWWYNHGPAMGGWHYHYWNQGYPPNYWWTVPVWGSLTNWFTWSAPQTVWQQPVYYDYGTGGNVTYQDNDVYVGGEQVATADEFAQSAMDLATVPPPKSEEQAVEAEWMPLGTFAVSMNEKDVEPSQVVQLAVSKDGILSGTLYNIDTDQSQVIQGQVDKETQRVAFRIGESEDIVAETGLYNLTQQEAPVLVHFGTERVENYLLVRLEEPETDQSDPTRPSPTRDSGT